MCECFVIGWVLRVCVSSLCLEWCQRCVYLVDVDRLEVVRGLMSVSVTGGVSVSLCVLCVHACK
jgi:hypothetical protein